VRQTPGPSEQSAAESGGLRQRSCQGWVGRRGERAEVNRDCTGGGAREADFLLAALDARYGETRTAPSFARGVQVRGGDQDTLDGGDVHAKAPCAQLSRKRAGPPWARRALPEACANGHYSTFNLLL
jgi:hypothetical protein